MGVNKGKEMIGIQRNSPLNTLEELRGLVAGIDASILLMSIVKGNRHLQQKFWMVPAVDFDLELHYALNETLLVLRRYDIKPVFVFDGFRNPVKADETARRQGIQNKAIENLKIALQKSNPGGSTNINSLYSAATYISEETTASTLLWCNKNSIKTVQAPFEADSQLFSLLTDTIIDFIITEDTDLIYIGSKCVVTDLDWKVAACALAGGSDVRCNIVRNSYVRELLGRKWNLPFSCSNHDLVVVANMLGTDYCSIQGVGPEKVNRIMMSYYGVGTSNVERHAFEHTNTDKLMNAINNVVSRPRVDELDKFWLGVNSFLYGICFKVISQRGPCRDAFFSEKFWVKLSTMNSLPMSLVQTITRALSPYNSIQVFCSNYLKFNLSDRSKFYGVDWSDNNTIVQIFTSSIYGKTGKKPNKIYYKDEEPKLSVIDFTKIHIDNVPTDFLFSWLHHRRVNISPNSKSETVKKAVQSILPHLDKYPIHKKVSECPENYLAIESLIMPIDGPGLDWVKNPSDVHKLLTTFLSTKDGRQKCVIDDPYIDKIFGKGRPSNRVRASRRLDGGHFNSGTLKCCKCLAKVGNGWVKSIAFSIDCTPSYRGSKSSDNYSILVFFRQDDGAFIDRPVSRCSCVDGRYFCSHMLGFVVLLYTIYKVGASYISALPEAVLNFKTECISLNYFISNIYRKPNVNKEVFDYLDSLTDDIDSDEDDEMREQLAKDDKMRAQLAKDDKVRAQLLAKDVVKKSGDDTSQKKSIIDKADDLIKRSLRISTTTSTTEDGKQEEIKFLELGAKTSVNAIRESSRLQLRRGPNASRQSSILRYEMYERWHEMVSKKLLPVSQFSYWLDHTVEERRDLLLKLKDPNLDYVEVIIGTAQIPPGMYLMADRGMAGDSVRYKHFNTVLTPAFLEGEKQFTTAEIMKTLPICKNRYSSEALFSRVTDVKILQGVIQFIEFAFIESAIAWGHAKNNMGLPYYDPQNWDDYILKVRGAEYLEYIQKKKATHKVLTEELYTAFKSLNNKAKASKKRKSTS